MCRWLVYDGPSLRVGELLFQPKNSIVRQSLDAHEGSSPVNGDGFGLGWYDPTDPVPCLYRSVRPAWNDTNLRELARNLRSGTFIAHVRAATEGAVQQTNCHPFRHGRWMLCHNGTIEGFPQLRRELMLAIDPSLYPSVEGTTDSEVLFYLALTFGLDTDPHRALEAAVGFIERVAERTLGRACVQMTMCATDGQRTYAARHATTGRPRTLYTTTDPHTLRHMCDGTGELLDMPANAEVHLVVSEPLEYLPGRWTEVAPATFLTLAGGEVEARSFTPSVTP